MMRRASRSSAWASATVLSGMLAALGCNALTGVGDYTFDAKGAGGARSSVGSGGASASSAASGGGGGAPKPTVFDAHFDPRLDLLLLIDNSRSMQDKQQILASAVPDLVAALLSPPCVDAEGAVTSSPASPLDGCEAGSSRAAIGVLDAHVGIVSSSLGAHGGDTCPVTMDPTNDDHGHLLSRGQNGDVATYAGEGFLAWDPAASLHPPGIASTDDIGARLTDLVIGTGQTGCGFESQLEAWYRFLVDPAPYATIAPDDPLKPTTFTQSGVDSVLLAQRKEFLRSDSVLGVVVLTDEDDCSVREYGPFPALTNSPPMPRARSECASKPGSHCCVSCAEPTPSGCPVDPTCTTPLGGVATLTAAEDPLNLRCFDVKRRFGEDFLYPAARYVVGLSSLQLPDPHHVFDGAGHKIVQPNDGVDLTGSSQPLVVNPVFDDLNPGDPTASHVIREPADVFFAGIVGVPWQDIARDPTDLAKGLLTGAELAGDVPGKGFTYWDAILGDPDKFVAPRDPHMIPSSTPRSGTDPITGTALAPPSAADDADPLNGHEWTTPSSGDLEYACVFDLPTPRDCSDPSITSCDCTGPTPEPTNPLCDDTVPTTQDRAKAYPATRELAVLKGLGAQGVVASICPADLRDATSASYGYRAAIQALADAVRPRLSPVACVDHALEEGHGGAVACHVIEESGKAPCNPACTQRPDRAKPEPATLASIPGATGCLCEILPVADAAGHTACVSDPRDPPLTPQGKSVSGYCYVDPGDAGSDASLVSRCGAKPRGLRFVGTGHPAPGATLHVVCDG